jgi:hypothetical protein
LRSFSASVFLDHHLLGEELRLAALPLDQERHPGVVILHDDSLHQRVAALACTQYVFEP